MDIKDKPQGQAENNPNHEPTAQEPYTREILQFIETTIPSAIKYFEARVVDSTREQLGRQFDQKYREELLKGELKAVISSYPYGEVDKAVEFERRFGKAAVDQDTGETLILSNEDEVNADKANATHARVHSEENDNEGRVMPLANKFDPSKVNRTLEGEGLIPMDEVDFSVVERYVNSETSNVHYRLGYNPRSNGGPSSTFLYYPSEKKIRIVSMNGKKDAVTQFAREAGLNPEHIQEINLRVHEGHVITEITTYPSPAHDLTTIETRVVNNYEDLNERVSGDLVKIVNDINRIGILDPGEASPVYAHVVFDDYENVMRMGSQPGELNPTSLYKASTLLIKPNKEDKAYEELDSRDPFGFVKEYEEASRKSQDDDDSTVFTF